MNRGRALTAGVGVLLALGVFACSSSSGNNANQNIPADRAAAQAASLKLSDFPPASGWASSATPPEDLDSQVVACLGGSAESPGDAPASYGSGNFSNGPDIASSVIGYWATAHDAKRSFDTLSKRNFPKCAAAAIKAQAESELNDLTQDGATFSTPTVSRMTFPTIGNMTIAHQAELTVTAGKESEELYVDDVLSLNGRALVEIIFSEAGDEDGSGSAQAGDTDDETRSAAEHYTRVVVGRLARTSATPPGDHRSPQN